MHIFLFCLTYLFDNALPSTSVKVAHSQVGWQQVQVITAYVLRIFHRFLVCDVAQSYFTVLFCVVSLLIFAFCKEVRPLIVDLQVFYRLSDCQMKGIFFLLKIMFKEME